MAQSDVVPPETELPKGVRFTVDSFADGIAFGQQRLEPNQDPRDFNWLRLSDDADLPKLRSRYALHRQNPMYELERHLMRLSGQGMLRDAQIYFGVTTDPFHPFAGKFDASMKFLELFRRYTPGMLQVQTRSPLLVIALPVFKRLGAQAAVTIALETPDEGAVRRYTPGLPRVDERLKVATALRRFGIEVTIQVGPILPYGDWRQDAARFAQILVEHADFIHVRPLTDGSHAVEKKIRGTALAQKLAQDRKFHWLRPDTAVPLLTAIEKLAPGKLLPPNRPTLNDRQVKLFAT